MRIPPISPDARDYSSGRHLVTGRFQGVHGG
jgi:hypothetical protein